MDANETAQVQLWPPAEYDAQIAALKAAVGKTIYLAEITEGEMNAGVKFSDHAYCLLAVVDFPQPDPYRQLCPHMLILDDGRGVNLGRIARVTVDKAFMPDDVNILYANREFLQQVVFAPRKLSKKSLGAATQNVYRRMLGPKPGRLLIKDQESNK